MKNIAMTIEQRIRAAWIIGQERGNVSQMRSLLFILDKIELSKEEKKNIKLEELQGGALKWGEDDASQKALRSKKAISFENDEANKLKELLVNFKGISAFDLKNWLGPLLEQWNLDRKEKGDE